MTKTHTGGPWRFDADWYRIPTIFGADGSTVASIEKDKRESTPIREANARLITAAPDLLKALEECRAQLDAVKDGSVGGIPNSIVALIPEAIEHADEVLLRAKGPS